MNTAELMTKYGSIIWIVVLLAVFYFMLIRPQQKQAKERKAMMEGIKPGDTVVTNGGIIGKVVKRKDHFVLLECGPDRVKLKFSVDAIGTVEKSAKEKDTDDTDEEDSFDEE